MAAPHRAERPIRGVGSPVGRRALGGRRLIGRWNSAAHQPDVADGGPTGEPHGRRGRPGRRVAEPGGHQGGGRRPDAGRGEFAAEQPKLAYCDPSSGAGRGRHRAGLHHGEHVRDPGQPGRQYSRLAGRHRHHADGRRRPELDVGGRSRPSDLSDPAPDPLRAGAAGLRSGRRLPGPRQGSAGLDRRRGNVVPSPVADRSGPPLGRGLPVRHQLGHRRRDQQRGRWSWPRRPTRAPAGPSRPSRA